MKTRYRIPLIATTSLVFLLLSQTSHAAIPAKPAALLAMEKEGFSVAGTFPTPGGLTGWAGYRGQQPVAFYATPDGKHVIAGIMFDANGNEVTQAALQKAVAEPMTNQVWQSLEKSTWIGDGKSNAARVVYVFTDTECPYCIQFWNQVRPWVDSGKVQVRHILVGMLRPDSAAKAASLLLSKTPEQALARHSRVANSKASGIDAFRPPTGKDALQPISNIPAKIQRQLDDNLELMFQLRLQATPAIAWKNSAGTVQMRTGIPSTQLTEILGPK